MSDTLTTLGEDIRALASQAAEVVADANLTQAEKAEKLDGLENDIRVKSLERIAAEAAVADERGIALAREDAAEGSDRPAVEARSWGDQFVNSEAFQAIVGSKGSRSQFASGPVEIQNATMTTIASPVVQPDFTGGLIDIKFDPPKVESLFASGSTSSNTIRYLIETTATNAAAGVAQEGLKPESTLILDEVDEPVRKIATTLKVTDEMLDDLPFVASYINSRGGLFVALETNDQLLNGTGTNDLVGLLNRSGLAADVPVGSDPTADAIYKQITAIRSNAFMEPDGIVIHPEDWEAIRLSKDANDQYYAGGPFMGQYGVGGFAGDVLWGLRVIVTSAIAKGTILVGAFGTCGQVFNRKGLTVEATNSNENDFIYNRVTFRFERRLALAIYRPGAFGVVDVEGS